MKLKRIIALILALATLLSLASCGGGKDPENKEENDGIDYRITVTDVFGEVASGMVVTVFDKNGDQVEMRMTDKDGVAKPKSPLASGKYTFEISDPKGGALSYDKDACVLSEGKEKVAVTLYTSTEGNPEDILYIKDNYEDDGTPALVLSDGGYLLDLEAGKNYFVFSPSARGKYTISVKSDKVSAGYYGSPHFVQDMNLASTDGSGEVYMSDGDLCFNIRIFNVGDSYYSSSRYVFMLEAEEALSTVLTITCNPELEMSVEEYPWNDYLLPATPEKYTLPGKDAAGFALTDVDITDKNLTIVYNSATDTYHVGSVDGPVLLMKMTAASKYLASFETIMETATIMAYIYDDDGKFVDKIIYQQMMSAYCEAADDDYGVLPLTSHIVKALTDYGNANYWYDLGSAMTIFSADAAAARPELLVYFACCYIAA